MGNANERSRITSPLLGMLAITIELHPVLQAYNLGVQEGLIFIIEDSKHADWLRNQLRMTGTKIITTSKLTQVDEAQEGVCFYQYKIYDKPERLLEFLHSKSRSIPTVMVHNIIPTCLQNLLNIIPLSEMKTFETDTNVNIDAIAFINYVRNNPKWLCEQIRTFTTSRLYNENGSESSLVVALKTSFYLFYQFYRLQNLEVDADVMSHQLLEGISKFEDLIDSYTCDTDIPFAVKKFFRKYVFEHSDIVVANVEEITGSIYESVQEDKVVLYDENLYYISETLFKAACQPLYSSVSFLNIKRILHAEGILLINQNATGGYTCKKTIFSMYGVCIRPRFLKIRKDFLTSMSEPNLEEKGECYDVCRRF